MESSNDEIEPGCCMNLLFDKDVLCFNQRLNIKVLYCEMESDLELVSSSCRIIKPKVGRARTLIEHTPPWHPPSARAKGVSCFAKKKGCATFGRAITI
ncbi:hypothetical protein CEXT_243971 [Caerostris extrusa]|uniref:Uncharacterized protein n=1 Tax=Caerostris extrusa TaxID=172846 RepID=A0AAV4RPL8_CAEEX|nr:hypothetical protein CEXT_243971 [Caerostris extrusa]